MSFDLNTALELWLKEGGDALQKRIAKDISNRVDHYPAIGEILEARPVDIPRLTKKIGQCELNRHKRNRIIAFMRNAEDAREFVTNLIDELPEHPDDVAEHIDEFIDYAVDGGFVTDEGRPDRSGSAMFVSLLLSARYPERFIDYPSTKRWREFAQRLGYVFPDAKTYGQRIVWACGFAQRIAAQPVFRLRWPDIEPMWVVSALCWVSGQE